MHFFKVYLFRLVLVPFIWFWISGVGTKWSNFHKPLSVDYNLSFLHVILAMCAASLFFVIVTWYVDAVKPGEYGVPEPFYFPFTASRTFNQITLSIIALVSASEQPRPITPTGLQKRVGFMCIIVQENLVETFHVFFHVFVLEVLLVWSVRKRGRFRGSTCSWY